MKAIMKFDIHYTSAYSRGILEIRIIGIRVQNYEVIICTVNDVRVSSNN